MYNLFSFDRSVDDLVKTRLFLFSRSFCRESSF